MTNRLKPAETYTHTDKSLLSPKQIGTICFAILISVFSFSNTVYASDCDIPDLDTGPDGDGIAYIAHDRSDS